MVIHAGAHPAAATKSNMSSFVTDAGTFSIKSLRWISVAPRFFLCSCLLRMPGDVTCQVQKKRNLH